MPTRLLLLPFAVLLLGFAYGAIVYDPQYAYGIIFPFIVMVMAVVFSPQIDWWWYRRYTPNPPAKLLAFIEKHSFFFRQLQPAAQDHFRKRLFLFPLAKDFKSQAQDGEVPADLKLVVAASALPLTFQEDPFWLPQFETVVVYPRPFPSPQYPELFHTSETQREDGVVLFSAEHLLHGFMDPQRYYDIGLHEWSQVYIYHHPALPWPELTENFWDELQLMSGFSRAAIARYINRPDVELLPAALVHFFHFPGGFQVVAPAVYQQFMAIFPWLAPEQGLIKPS